MRHLLLLAACLIAGPLAADTIGKVKYCLPNQGKEWKILNDIKSARKTLSTTKIYVPKSSKLKTKEFFGVHLNDKSIDLGDFIALENGIKVQYPEQKVRVAILETTPESILYEWVVMDEEEKEEEQVHGWTRVFSLNKETVMLTYQTQQPFNVDAIRSIWVRVLKEAEVIR